MHLKGIIRQTIQKIQCAPKRAQSSVLSPRNFNFLLTLFLLIPLTLYLIPSAVHAAAVDLEWDANTEPELAGYKIHWGISDGQYTSSKDVGNTTTCTITGLDEGKTYYFAATAYDGGQTESDYSNQVIYTVPLTDSDGDGVPDNQDDFPSDPDETTDTDGDGTGNNADTDDDNDKMPDTWELQYGFNPLIDDASNDSDGDGISNLDEYYAGTDPTVPPSDSDGDGVPDNEDAFPADASETTDTDNDGTGNNADTDDDNDKMPDDWEIQYGLDPLKDDASNDADGDGVSNLDEFYADSDPVVPQDNFEPDAPILTTPTNQLVVQLTPELKTGKFIDPNSGDFHSATQWQIIRESDDVCIFNITSEDSLTRLEVPKLILDQNEDYTWKARHYDNHGTPSNWSSSGAFSTNIDPEDSNDNGIPDVQEVDTISDLDGDGTDDAAQNTIKCVKTAQGKALGISFKGSSTVVSIESMSAEYDDQNEIYAADSSTPTDFPFGLINFKLIMNQPGDQAVITVYFSEPAPEGGIWFKYDPIEATWTDFSSQTAFSADRQSITLYLEDGGEGDADGIVNGIIVDPSGVGVSSFSGGSSAGGASCFISTASSRLRPRQAGPVWNEIRGRELAIVAVLLGLLQALMIVFRRIKERWEEMQRRYEMYHERGPRFTASDIIKAHGSPVESSWRRAAKLNSTGQARRTVHVASQPRSKSSPSLSAQNISGQAKRMSQAPGMKISGASSTRVLSARKIIN